MWYNAGIVTNKVSKRMNRIVFIKFNPPRPSPFHVGSRNAAIKAAIASQFIPTAIEAIEAIEAAQNEEHLGSIKATAISVNVSGDISDLSLRMASGFWGEDLPSIVKTELSLWQPARLWVTCAIHAGIKSGVC